MSEQVIYQSIQVVPEDKILAELRRLLDTKSFPPVMTLEQVSQYTQYTRQTILKFIKEQNFPVSNRCERPRFVKSEVDKWLKGEI